MADTDTSFVDGLTAGNLVALVGLGATQACAATLCLHRARQRLVPRSVRSELIHKYNTSLNTRTIAVGFGVSSGASFQEPLRTHTVKPWSPLPKRRYFRAVFPRCYVGVRIWQKITLAGSHAAVTALSCACGPLTHTLFLPRSRASGTHTHATVPISHAPLHRRATNTLARAEAPHSATQRQRTPLTSCTCTGSFFVTRRLVHAFPHAVPPATRWPLYVQPCIPG